VAVKCRDGNAVHRAGQPLGERILRELQREAARRVLEWRDLLLAEGGTDRDRTVEGGVQHAAAALGARIQAADTGGLYRRSAKPNFATHGYDLNPHTRGGVKNSVRSA